MTVDVATYQCCHPASYQCVGGDCEGAGLAWFWEIVYRCAGVIWLGVTSLFAHLKKKIVSESSGRRSWMFWRRTAVDLHWSPCAIDTCSQRNCSHDAVATSERPGGTLQVSGSHIFNKLPTLNWTVLKVNAKYFPVSSCCWLLEGEL